MHTALWKLYRLQVRGTVRSLAGKLKSLRGAALAVFTLLVLGMMVGPNLILVATTGRTGIMGQRADAFREVFPVGMFAYVVISVVTSLGERAIYFSPSEVDFLFPAPFSRRQILLYKILGSLIAAVYLALLFPLMLIVYIRSWPAAMAGCFLAWLTVNSLVLCAQLAAQIVTERAFSRSRQWLLGGVVAAAAVALGQAAGRGLDGPWQETLLRARHAPLAEVLLAPFTMLAGIITAPRFSDVLGWAALAAALVAGVYALAIRLDANYLETAARVSQKMQERRRRAMSGGFLAAASHRGLQSSRLPQPPWWGGVGPLVWRQTIQAFRGSRGAMVLAAIVAAAIGLPLLFAARGHSDFLPHIVVGVAAYATFLVSSQAPFGFRGDYERMALLKSLPIRPAAMACGETLVTAMILTLLQCSVFAVTAIFVPAAAGELLAAGLFALPFNWILLGTENFLFLLYPAPLVVTGSEGFLKVGRLMLSMLVKFLVLAACGAVSAVLAVAAYLATASLPAACLAAWVALLFPALGILLLAAWAFQRYDVTAGAWE